MQRTLLRTWLQYVVRQWQLCLLTVVAAPRRCTGGSAQWTAARMQGTLLISSFQRMPADCGGCAQEALMPAQALHRRLSSVDSSAHAGDGSELLPHTALRRCLDAWVPLLIDECDFAAAFLLLYKPMDEVPGAGQDAFAGERRGNLTPVKMHDT